MPRLDRASGTHIQALQPPPITSSSRQVQALINSDPNFANANLQLPRFFDTAAPTFAPTPGPSLTYPQFVAVVFCSVWVCAGLGLAAFYWRYQVRLV